jgi:prolipoprotein diacylglyceryltransferase
MEFQFLSDNWITPFGVIFVAAGVVMWWWSRKIAVSLDVDSSHMDLLVPLALFAGIVGGTMLTFLTPTDKNLAGEALQTWLRIRFFGMAISGAIAVFIYSRFANFSFRSLLDILALPTIGALFVHRFGCLIAGCCWGDIAVHTQEISAIADTSLGMQIQTLHWLTGEWVVWGIQYPPGSFAYAQQVAMGLIDLTAAASLPVHPVQMYEAAGLLIMMLWFWRTPLDRYPRGTVAATIVGIYAGLRFFLEYLRADGNIVLGNLTMTQIQCVVLLVAALLTLTVQSKSRNAIS